MVEPLELMKLDNYLSSYTMLPNGKKKIKKMFMESTSGGIERERKKIRVNSICSMCPGP